MFDIGWSELLIIGIVALIAIGPKELPAVLRTVGQYMGKIRRMASEFQGQFQEAMREAELADVKQEFDEMTEAASDLTDFDPLAEVQKEFDTALDDKPHDAAATETATVSDAAANASPAPAPAADDTDVVVAPEPPQPKPAPEPETKPASSSGSGA
jgi:sec-independent protein translocase protein TatB